MSSSDVSRQRVAPHTATFGAYRLHSVFQTIFSLSHRRAVGFEALVRPQLGAKIPVSPAGLFGWASDHGELRALDAACQRLHVRNFAAIAPPARWLFLNVDAQTITSRGFDDGLLAGILEQASLGPHRLVIEILEGRIRDEGLLLEAVDYFRSLGALVALDDFGTGHSNFDRVWRLAPDIIKLDGSLMAQAEAHHSDRLRRILPNLVALMHEAGSFVLAEGVETHDQGLIALDADIDFVQGFHFGYPTGAINAEETAETTAALAALTQNFAETASQEQQASRQSLAPHLDVFRAVAEAIEQGTGFDDAVASLLALPRTARVYLLNEWGEEIGHYRGVEDRDARARRFDPVADTSGGTWFRRGYFRSAVNEPRRVQISRPYRSSTGTALCVTLSVCSPDTPHRVFCCDVMC